MLLYFGIPIAVAGVALYAVAYRYVYKFRDVFKELGIPFVATKNWTGIWSLYVDSDDFFEVEKDLVQKHGGIFGYFEGRTPALVVSDLELVRQVMLKDFDSFMDRRVPVKSRRRTIDLVLPTLTGARWKHVRQQVTPAFTPQALRRMYPLIWRTVEQLSDNIAKNPQEIDIRKFCGCFTMDVIASVAFGMELDSLNNAENPFVTNARKAFAAEITKGGLKYFMSTAMMFPFIFAWLVKMIPDTSKIMQPLIFFQNIVEDEIKRRQSAVGGVERPDFLQMIMHLEKDPKDPANRDQLEYDEFGLPWLRNGLTHEEIVAQSVLFFLAGYETTANVLLSVLFALAQNPDCQERLYDEINNAKVSEKAPSLDTIFEMKYLEMCINETLRLYSPVCRHERFCTSATTVGGFHVPKDMVVLVPAHAIHHDPNLWPDPEKFDPERFSPENSSNIHPMAFMPFGLGNRNCIGMRLASLEVKLALVNLVRRFQFKVSTKTQLPVSWKPAFNRSPASTIYLDATLR